MIDRAEFDEDNMAIDGGINGRETSCKCFNAILVLALVLRQDGVDEFTDTLMPFSSPCLNHSLSHYRLHQLILSLR